MYAIRSYYAGIAAERFIFIPSIGVCIALALGIMRISRTQKTDWLKYKPDALYSIVIMIVIMAIYGTITINRNADWKDVPTLYKADVLKLERSRITSYNVCYTKLLRAVPKKWVNVNINYMYVV